MANRLYDLTGMKFGRWTVLGRAGNDERKAATWLCRCECGAEKVVRGYALRYGHTRSCGCLQSEEVASRNKKHDGSRSRIYMIWDSMKKRCYNSNEPAYKNYGGRGIKMCDEWLNSFAVFREWALKNGYSDDLTIDRIDNNGDYCPQNCRWANAKTQCNNRRSNRCISYNGQVHTVSEWSDIIGISQDVIRARIKLGWTVERALTEKVRMRRWRKKPANV